MAMTAMKDDAGLEMPIGNFEGLITVLANDRQFPAEGIEWILGFGWQVGGCGWRGCCGFGRAL